MKQINPQPNAAMKRRTFTSLLLSTGAMAFGANDKRDDMEPFHWARVKFDNDGRTLDTWDAVPEADVVLLQDLKKCTGLNIDTTRYVAPLDNLEEMCKFPFLFMTTDGTFVFTPEEQANLVEYVKRGGFLFADDCVAQDTNRIDAFFLDFRDKVEHLFGKKMVRLPNRHEIYHSFFDLPNGLPHVQGVEHGGHALFIDERMAIFLSPSDIHCGWYDCAMKRRGYQGWYPGVHTENAIKMGINIFMYVMSH